MNPVSRRIESDQRATTPLVTSLMVFPRVSVVTDTEPDVRTDAASTGSVNASPYEFEDYDCRNKALAPRSFPANQSSLSRARALATLADLQAEAGHHTTALDMYAQAIALAEPALGRFHPKLGDMLLNRGLVGLEAELVDQAAADLERARDIFVHCRGLRDGDIGWVDATVARLALINGDPARALVEATRASAMYRRIFPPDDISHAEPLLLRARAHLAMGQFTEATSSARQAVALYDSPDDGPIPDNTKRAGNTLASSELSDHKSAPNDDGTPARTAGSMTHAHAQARRWLGMALLGVGRPREAIVELDAAIDTWTHMFGDSDRRVDTIEARLARADAYLALGRYKAADAEIVAASAGIEAGHHARLRPRFEAISCKVACEAGSLHVSRPADARSIQS